MSGMAKECRSLYRYVLKELIDRSKMGFGAPIDSCLRVPLKGCAETLLDEERLRLEGYFNPKPIRDKRNEDLGVNRNHQNSLWCMIMYQSWLESQ